MDYRKAVTPAIVGVVSFAAGIGAHYAFERYRNKASAGSKLQAENGSTENQNGIVENQNGEGNVERRDYGSEIAQLHFMFEERDRKYDLQIQQMMKAVVVAQDSSRIPREGDLNEILHTEGVEYVADEEDDWNYDEEVDTRSPERPYIIHRDEFFAEEMDFTHSTLTYYRGDDILVDDHDVPIYNPEKLVGQLRFGHGSEDPSIVYIRNEETEGEFEILLEEGTFADILVDQKVHKDLGARDLKHSILKFREE